MTDGVPAASVVPGGAVPADAVPTGVMSADVMSGGACASWSDPVLVAAIIAVAPAGLGVRVRMPAGSGRDSWLALLRFGLQPDQPMRRCPASIDDNRLLGGLDLAATLAARRRVITAGLLAGCDNGVLVLPTADRLSPALAARVGAVLESGELVLERDGVAAILPARFGVVVLDESGDEGTGPPTALLDRLAFTVGAGATVREASLDHARTGKALGQSGPFRTPAPVAEPAGSSGVVPIALQPRADPLRPADSFEPPPGYDALLGQARARLDGVLVPDAVSDALCGTAMLAGIGSLRAPLLALRVARIVAALDGRDRVDDGHACIAARLVLAPRATVLPIADVEEQGAPQQPGDASDASGPAGEQTADRSEAAPTGPAATDAGDTGGSAADSDAAATDAAGTDITGVVLDAVRAAIPATMLDHLRASSAVPVQRPPAARTSAGRTESGRQGRQPSASRGRPVGSAPGDPSRGRLDVLATLRAALPWQALRRDAVSTSSEAGATPRIRVRREDFRIVRFVPRLRLVTIFVVDASGSAARARLAEAKGCVSILLADCYARRDQVALIECRNAGASVLLPPTGAVVRARRALDGLPGGGGTPLASGLDAALALAARVRRDGGTPRLVLLTDGRANVARDGAADRERAMRDALVAAGSVRAAAIPSLLVDISSRPRAGATPDAVRLAEALGARCLALPRNDPETLAREAAALAAPGRPVRPQSGSPAAGHRGQPRLEAGVPLSAGVGIARAAAQSTASYSVAPQAAGVPGR